MPFDPKVPKTPLFWTVLERKLREAVRLRALRERRVQTLQSAAGAVATIASFGAGLMMMLGSAAPISTPTTGVATSVPVTIDVPVVSGTPQTLYYYPTTSVTLPDRLASHGYEVTVLTRFVTDPAAHGAVLDVRGPTMLDVTGDPAAGPVVIIIGQAVGTGLSFAG